MLLMPTAAIAFAACNGTKSTDNDADYDKIAIEEYIAEDVEYEEIETISSIGLILMEDPSLGKSAIFNSDGEQVTEFKYVVEQCCC